MNLTDKTDDDTSYAAYTPLSQCSWKCNMPHTNFLFRRTWPWWVSPIAYPYSLHAHWELSKAIQVFLHQFEHLVRVTPSELSYFPLYLDSTDKNTKIKLLRVLCEGLLINAKKKDVGEMLVLQKIWLGVTGGMHRQNSGSVLPDSVSAALWCMDVWETAWEVDVMVPHGRHEMWHSHHITLVLARDLLYGRQGEHSALRPAPLPSVIDLSLDWAAFARPKALCLTVRVHGCSQFAPGQFNPCHRSGRPRHLSGPFRSTINQFAPEV